MPVLNFTEDALCTMNCTLVNIKVIISVLHVPGIFPGIDVTCASGKNIKYYYIFIYHGWAESLGFLPFDWLRKCNCQNHFTLIFLYF